MMGEEQANTSRLCEYVSIVWFSAAEFGSGTLTKICSQLVAVVEANMTISGRADNLRG
jgi:hypothetical protein